MVGSSGVINGQYGSPDYWSICQCQVDNRLAFLVLSCPMVGAPAISANLQSVLVNHPFPESSNLLHMASWVPSFAVGIEVSCDISATVVVGKRLPPLQSHAFEWVRDWVRVIAALHHAIDKVEKPSLDGIRDFTNHVAIISSSLSFFSLLFLSF
jgi:hypothetical protein